MCEFISSIEHKGEHYYLTSKDLQGKRFDEFKKENPKWQEDICGHGAILFFYPELKGKGNHWEYIDFSSPDNFPECIVKDIKKGLFNGIGICLDILNDKGKKEYKKIEQPAREEYNKIKQPAWEEYKKIEQSVLEEYKKIQQPVWEEYKRIEQPAWEEYNKIEQSAWAEYNKIEQSAFWAIAKQKKYRQKLWK